MTLQWVENGNNDDNSTDIAERNTTLPHHYDTNEAHVLQSWASRTFSATCYKFTVQNSPETRSKTGPIYSFLENWQLHTMYNKSQKILLGIDDIRPCVLLTGDDFMFTPPPLQEPTTTASTFLYQQHMAYLDDDEERTMEDTNEPSWMLYQPLSSQLHVVNVTHTDDDDDEDDDDDDTMDDQPIMIMGRDATFKRSSSSAPATTVNPILEKWHQPVEPPLKPRTTWGQWLQHGLFFVSQRTVEVAYLVAEVAESMATDRHTTHKPAPKGGVVHLFRVWRVFFLGVETMLHQLFALDTSLPLL